MDSTFSVPQPNPLLITSALDTLSASDLPYARLTPAPPKPHTEIFQRDFLNMENLTISPPVLTLKCSKSAPDKVQTAQVQNWMSESPSSELSTLSDIKRRWTLETDHSWFPPWSPHLLPAWLCNGLTLLIFHFFTDKIEHCHDVLHIECTPC